MKRYTPVRHAADVTFFYDSAIRAAIRAERRAQNPEAAELARSLREATAQLRKHSKRLERLL